MVELDVRPQMGVEPRVVGHAVEPSSPGLTAPPNRPDCCAVCFVDGAVDGEPGACRMPGIIRSGEDALCFRPLLPFAHLFARCALGFVSDAPVEFREVIGSTWCAFEGVNPPYVVDTSAPWLRGVDGPFSWSGVVPLSVPRLRRSTRHA